MFEQTPDAGFDPERVEMFRYGTVVLFSWTLWIAGGISFLAGLAVSCDPSMSNRIGGLITASTGIASMGISVLIEIGTRIERRLPEKQKSRSRAGQAGERS